MTTSDQIADNTEYKNRWNEHIDELNGLAWNLKNKEDRDELTKIIHRLKELTEKASKHRNG